MKPDLLIISAPYTPVLSVVKDGCNLPNVEFVALKPPSGFGRFFFHVFRILHLYSLALFLISPATYKKILKYKKAGVKVLFWNSHNLTIWMSIEKILKPSQKYVFSWAPMDEDIDINQQRFFRKLKRIEIAQKNGFEFYTYNPNDAKKYGMHLTTQVHRKNWNFSIMNDKRDFYFIGASKKRDKILVELKEKLNQKGFIVDFRLFDDNSKEMVPFDENIHLAMGSRCIVDVVAKQYNAGQTLRPLEALFFKKKLLTNDSSIVNCDFYHPDNIFIFDETNINLNGIEEFMQKPFHEIDESITNKYDVNYWLKHFFINGDA